MTTALPLGLTFQDGGFVPMTVYSVNYTTIRHATATRCPSQSLLNLFIMYPLLLLLRHNVSHTDANQVEVLQHILHLLR